MKFFFDDFFGLIDTNLADMAINSGDQDEGFCFVPSAERTPVVFITSFHEVSLSFGYRSVSHKHNV